MAEQDTTDASVSSIMEALTLTEQPNTVIDVGKIPAESATSAIILTETDASEVYQAPSNQVFGINELVGLILERIPTQNRSQLRRVSKAWSTIITDIGHAIHLIDPIVAGCNIPCYEIEEILANSGLEVSSFSSEPWKATEPEFVAFEEPSNSSLLSTRRHEFVTSPPITTVMLAISMSTAPLTIRRYHRKATLTVHAGIRIGHLLDMFNRMQTPQCAFLLSPVAYFTLRSPGSEATLEKIAALKVRSIVLDS
jgi:hypothetical protein